MFALSGPTRDRALAVARRANALGRTMIAVGQDGDIELSAAAEELLPLAGVVREEFSPLPTQVVADYLAAEVADRLGRVPFSTNRP